MDYVMVVGLAEEMDYVMAVSLVHQMDGMMVTLRGCLKAPSLVY